METDETFCSSLDSVTAMASPLPASAHDPVAIKRREPPDPYDRAVLALKQAGVLREAFLAEKAVAIVLREIRQPNPRMVRAAGKAMSPDKRPTSRWVSVSAKHGIRFRAMIDELLQRHQWTVKTAIDAALNPEGSET